MSGLDCTLLLADNIYSPTYGQNRVATGMRSHIVTIVSGRACNDNRPAKTSNRMLGSA